MARVTVKMMAPYGAAAPAPKGRRCDISGTWAWADAIAKTSAQHGQAASCAAAGPAQLMVMRGAQDDYGGASGTKLRSIASMGVALPPAGEGANGARAGPTSGVHYPAMPRDCRDEAEQSRGRSG